MYNLTGKSIIITGGGSGMGREAALLAAKAGARLTIADIGVEGGQETVRLIAAAGGTAQFIRTNIAEEAQAAAMVAAAVSAYGRLDGAFNNAAVPQNSVALHELTGTFFCMKHEIIQMLKNGGGAIVNTASAAGVTAFPAACEYVTSKHAVVGMTKAGAIDYGTQGIRVNAILPGATLTPMLTGAIAGAPGLEQYLIDQQPIGRLGLPAEIATAAVWLLSDHASFVTGASFAIDGGYTAK